MRASDVRANVVRLKSASGQWPAAPQLRERDERRRELGQRGQPGAGRDDAQGEHGGGRGLGVGLRREHDPRPGDAAQGQAGEHEDRAPQQHIQKPGHPD